MLNSAEFANLQWQMGKLEIVGCTAGRGGNGRSDRKIVKSLSIKKESQGLGIEHA